MADRLVDILEEQRQDLLRSLELMRSGVFSTRSSGEDSTEASMAQTIAWIGGIDEALECRAKSKRRRDA